MLAFLYRLWLRIELFKLAIVRRILITDKNLYIFLNAREVQPALAAIGRLRAHAVFLKASKKCPAYREFLAQEGYQPQKKWALEQVPVMTKENYVKKHSIEERCYGGAIPLAGVVIDESSGSTGQPNNWVRSAAEREDVKRILQINYEIIYRPIGVLSCCNCFALGPWATGMNVSLSLVDVGIMKSNWPGPQQARKHAQAAGPEIPVPHLWLSAVHPLVCR